MEIKNHLYIIQFSGNRYFKIGISYLNNFSRVKTHHKTYNGLKGNVIVYDGDNMYEIRLLESAIKKKFTQSEIIREELNNLDGWTEVRCMSKYEDVITYIDKSFTHLGLEKKVFNVDELFYKKDDLCDNKNVIDESISIEEINENTLNNIIHLFDIIKDNNDFTLENNLLITKTINSLDFAISEDDSELPYFGLCKIYDGYHLSEHVINVKKVMNIITNESHYELYIKLSTKFNDFNVLTNKYFSDISENIKTQQLFL